MPKQELIWRKERFLQEVNVFSPQKCLYLISTDNNFTCIFILSFKEFNGYWSRNMKKVLTDILYFKHIQYMEIWNLEKKLRVIAYSLKSPPSETSSINCWPQQGTLWKLWNSYRHYIINTWLLGFWSKNCQWYQVYIVKCTNKQHIIKEMCMDYSVVFL
jgi:hypothetical protein